MKEKSGKFERVPESLRKSERESERCKGRRARGAVASALTRTIAPPLAVWKQEGAAEMLSVGRRTIPVMPLFGHHIAEQGHTG